MIWVIFKWETRTLGELQIAKSFKDLAAADKWIKDNESYTVIAITQEIV
jgi:hypothetical protein